MAKKPKLKVGQTKTIKGKTYKLSKSHRWESVKKYGTDVLAGIDPTGSKTFQYAYEGRGKLSKALGITGGLVGGALVVPSAISGIVGGFSGFGKGRGGIKGRLVGAGLGFVRGLRAPVKGISSAVRLGKPLKAATKTGFVNLTAKQSKAATYIMKKSVPIKSFSKSIPKGRKFIGKDMAKQMQSIVSGELSKGVGAMAVSSAIGGSSAYLQFSKGRKYGLKYRRAVRKRRKR